MDHDRRFTAWLWRTESLSDLHRCANRWNRQGAKLKLNRSRNRTGIDRRGCDLDCAQQAWL
jgi:hypothetical protein